MVMFKILWIFCLGFAVGRKRECKQSPMGSDYQGTVSVTRNGLPCQTWTSQIPHAHNFTSHKLFPDTRVEDARNYCRNPESGMANTIGPWCFTRDPDVRYQFCDIPRCSAFPECRLTPAGTEYKGHVSVTSSGKDCLHWPSGEGEKNFCRNPEGRLSGPYCYVIGNETESCNIPFCKPPMQCKRTKAGTEYAGGISVTKSGLSCQRWDAQYPHPHNHTSPDQFPDATVEDAENYCRNPDNSEEGPWCYTTDPDSRREACNIDMCNDCKLSTNGREYAGTRATTVSGTPCLRWDDIKGNPFTADQFPDASISAAENFCRNPDNDPSGPFCYESQDLRKTCSIPLCEEKGHNVVRPAIANHVVVIGVDGLRPDCIKGAIGGAPNLLKRMASEGTHTLNRARTSLITISASGWSNVLCGMDIETTGVLGNSWRPTWLGYSQPLTPVTGNYSPLPCIFKELKSQDPSIRTASFYNWGWLTYMSNQGYPGAVDYEVKKLDAPVITDEFLAGSTKRYLKSLYATTEKSFTFLYFENVDSFGHGFSWCNFMYNLAVGQVDRQIGIVLDAIEEVNKENDTLVIVTSDHGGGPHGHGRYQDSDVLIPMFLKGPGIKKGHKFQRTVYNVDIAPTVMHALGYKPNPFWVGRVMDDAFEDFD